MWKLTKKKKWEFEIYLIYLEGRKPGKEMDAHQLFYLERILSQACCSVYFFLEKEVQRLHHFSLKFYFHTKPSSTDKQNIAANCNEIKLHWW